MPQNISGMSINEKAAFLLLFTKELIMNSGSGVSQLKEILKEENVPVAPAANAAQMKSERAREESKKGAQVEESKEPLIKSILSNGMPMEKQSEVSVMKPVHINPPRREISDGMPNRSVMTLRIPEPRLPEQFQYLQPAPTKLEVDLGKLNQLIMDPSVRTIECGGPDKPVIVTGGMGRKPSNVTLSNQEIEETIQKISKASKIPADTGVYRVVIGHLIFSAIISDVVPSRFMIKKMQTPRNFQQPFMGPKPLNPNFQLYFKNKNTPF